MIEIIEIRHEHQSEIEVPHNPHMIEIILKRHRKQTKFEMPHNPHMIYVVFFRIYGPFPTNGNKKILKIPCYYRYLVRPCKIHQS